MWKFLRWSNFCIFYESHSPSVEVKHVSIRGFIAIRILNSATSLTELRPLVCDHTFVKEEPHQIIPFPFLVKWPRIIMRHSHERMRSLACVGDHQSTCVCAIPIPPAYMSIIIHSLLSECPPLFSRKDGKREGGGGDKW